MKLSLAAEPVTQEQDINLSERSDTGQTLRDQAERMKIFLAAGGKVIS